MAQPFLAWLQAAVSARGVSWRKLADEAGVSHAALSALRTGKASQPSMETCYRLAGYLNHDLRDVLHMAGYAVDETELDLPDPELNGMFRGLFDLTPEEREPVKEFIRFALARAAERRRRAGTRSRLSIAAATRNSPARTA